MTVARDSLVGSLLREALEESIGRDRATAVIFDALLELDGELPEHGEPLLAFLRGPLLAALRRRADAETADEVRRQIEAALSAAVGGKTAGSRRVRSHRRLKRGFEEEAPTSPMRIPEAGPPRVVVLADGDRLAGHLLAAFGEERVYAVTLRLPEELPKLAKDVEPALALLDATDPPIVHSADLVAALSTLPEHCLRAVWASGGSRGAPLVKSLERNGVQVLCFDERDGVDPLLDVIGALADPTAAAKNKL
jgi:hypothetical protein